MAVTVSLAKDHSGNAYTLFSDGVLEKRNSSNALLWSQQTRQEPTPGAFVYANSITLDIGTNPWLTYDDALDIVVRNQSTGAVLGTVLGTPAAAMTVLAGGDFMYAISSSLGILHEINASTMVVNRVFDLNVLVPAYVKGWFVSQITSSATGRVYIGALIGPVGEAQLSAIVKFDPTGAGAFTAFLLGGAAVPVPAVSSNVSNQVYACDLHGRVYRFLESSSSVDFVYNPASPNGVVDWITFSSGQEPTLVDDGTFASSGRKTRAINPANGDQVSSSVAAEKGNISGDYLAYHHNSITRINVAPSPVVPAVDGAKISVFVKTNGTLTFTGKPGAVTNGITAECRISAGPILVGTATVNADGSFSVTSGLAVGNPVGGESVSVTAVNGAQTAVYNTASAVRNLPVAFDVPFMTSGLVAAGVSTRLKARITDTAGGAFTTPGAGKIPVFRLKRDSDGKWFNGGSFVSDNGDYLQGANDASGEFWYVDVTLPAGTAGSLSLIIKDSPPYFSGLFATAEPASQVTLLSVQAVLGELNAKTDIAFGAPAAEFTDPSTIGGFLFERVVDIQKNVRRLLKGAVGIRAVVVESILADVSTQSVPKGSTPSVDIAVYDEERRFPVDISGATVELKMKQNLSSSVLVVNQPAEILSGEDGMARAKLTAADTAVARRLIAQVVAVIPGVGTLVSPSFFFDVTESVL